MGKAFLCKSNGGGGGGLAFRVIGGTSAPSNPKPNDIWVNTDEKITSYIFSATEPEGYAEGMVWFSTGKSSPTAFNALKKNNITVYPLYAKQYVSGAWVDKEAKSYQNGEWVEWWKGELYVSGNQFKNATGGLKAVTTAMVQVTFNDENFVFVKTGQDDGKGYNAAVYTKNKIDVTEFKTLAVEVQGVTELGGYSAWGVHIGLSNYNTSYNPIGDKHTIATKKHNTAGAAIIRLDVTSIEGFYYPVIYCDVATCTVNKWYLS